MGELESPWSDSDDLPAIPPIEAIEFEEMLSETADAEQPEGAADDDSPPKERGRRRRRRGGRKSSDAGSNTSPSKADADGDVSAHDDDDSLTMPEGLAEASDSGEETGVENGEKTADDASERPRRRRRRRGGGKKKRAAREGAASDVAEAGALSDSEAIGEDLDADEDLADDLDEQDSDNPDPRHRSADPDDDDGDDEDSKGMKGHKGIPSWDEAVGCIIAVNMESRARNPHSSSSGPRGRGGRGGGGGPHRGGRGRPSGS